MALDEWQTYLQAMPQDQGQKMVLLKWKGHTLIVLTKETVGHQNGEIYVSRVYIVYDFIGCSQFKTCWLKEFDSVGKHPSLNEPPCTPKSSGDVILYGTISKSYVGS